MSSLIRALTFALIALALDVRAAPAVEGRRYAVLVGVGEYPNLGGHDLAGPRNDVVLMHETLRQRGFDGADIVVLADNVPRSLNATLPTRAAILRAIDQIIARLRPGDVLYLHFSGHGAQQPERVPGQEADEDDEIFLARDTSRWDQAAGTVPGAITDDEIGARLERAAARGALVWSVFDSCHSGSMTRGLERDPAPSVRQLSREDLGIPYPPRRTDLTGPDRIPGSMIDVTRRARRVTFYATSSDKLTQEYIGLATRGRAYGRLTWFLAQGLARYPQATYRQLGDFVHAQLKALPSPDPRLGAPYFEGHLDAPVFGDAAPALTRQWPVRADETSLWIDAGALNLFAPGARFALMTDARAPDTEAVSAAVATSVEATRARLVPVDANGRAVALSRHHRSATHARLVDANPSFPLRATVRLGTDETGRPVRPESNVDAALRGLRSGDANGPRLQWVPAGDPADIEVRVARDAIYVTPAGLPIVTEDPGRTPAVTVHDGNGGQLRPAESLRDALQGHVCRVATAVTLLRHASAGAAARDDSGLRSQVVFERHASSTTFTLSPGPAAFTAPDLPRFHAGDRIGIDAVNDDPNAPMDVTVFYVDAAYGIHLVYPAGNTQDPIRATQRRRRLMPLSAINDDPSGIEHVVVIASPYETGGTSIANALRSVAGACSSSQSRSLKEAETLVGRVLDRLGLGRNPEAATGAAPVTIRVYSWRTEKGGG